LKKEEKESRNIISNNYKEGRKESGKTTRDSWKKRRKKNLEI
jgi:hypothetical protein